MWWMAACATQPGAGGPSLEVTMAGVWHEGALGHVLPEYRALGGLEVSRRVEVPDAWAGRRLELYLPGTGWEVVAAVDGADVARGTGGLWPATLDLTTALSPGAHELTLRLAPTAPENVFPGQVLEVPHFWNTGWPRKGLVAARGVPTLRVGPPRPVSALGAELDGETLVVRMDAPGRPDGEQVRLAFVRDGARQSLGVGEVRGGRLVHRVAWSGPRWPAEEALGWLVAELDDATLQARVAPREARWQDGQFYLNGERQYVLGARFASMSGVGRAALAERAALLARAGGNALELHGEPPPAYFLAGTDELGLPVVYTPRCDGQRGLQGRPRPTAELLDYYALTDAAIVASLRPFPSLVLWIIEGSDVLNGRPLYGGLLAAEGIALVPGDQNGSLPDPALPAGPPQRVAPFLGELPWHGPSQEVAARLAGPLAEHLGRGGSVLPPAVADAPGAFGEVAAGLGIVPYRPSARRGISGLQVATGREGALVELVVPEQPPFAAFADTAGNAWFEVWYVGPAQVRSGGASAEVTLAAGTWEPPHWRPQLTKVDLVGG